MLKQVVTLKKHGKEEKEKKKKIWRQYMRKRKEEFYNNFNDFDIFVQILQGKQHGTLERENSWGKTGIYFNTGFPLEFLHMTLHFSVP